MGSRFHVECFSCHVCGVQMFQEKRSRNYTVVEEQGENRPYCDNCLKPILDQLNERRELAKKAKCFVCSKKFDDDEFLQSGDVFIHTKCFLCSKCNGALNPASIFNVGGKLCCELCAQQVQQNRKKSFVGAED